MTEAFQPRNPDYEATVRGSFGRQRVMNHLGIELEDVEPGRVCLAMPYAESLTQQHGFIHAGIMTTALDSACGYAAFSLTPSEADVLTIEFKSNFLAPGRGQRFEFEATVVKPGRTIMVCEGRAIAHDGDDRKLVATMTATVMAVLGRSDLK